MNRQIDFKSMDELQGEHSTIFEAYGVSKEREAWLNAILDKKVEEGISPDALVRWVNENVPLSDAEWSAFCFETGMHMGMGIQQDLHEREMLAALLLVQGNSRMPIH